MNRDLELVTIIATVVVLAACMPPQTPVETVRRPIAVETAVLEPFVYIAEIEEVRTVGGDLVGGRTVITVCRRDGLPACVRIKVDDAPSPAEFAAWLSRSRATMRTMRTDDVVPRAPVTPSTPTPSSSAPSP